MNRYAYIDEPANEMKRTPFILIVLVWLFVSGDSYAVNRHFIDSVETACKTAKTKKERFICLYTLTYEYGLFDPAKGLKTGQLFLREAVQEKDTSSIINAYNGLANCYETLMQFDSALHLNELHYELIRNSTKYHLQFVAFCNMAFCHKKLGHYNLAVQYYNRALDLIDKLPEHNPRLYYYLSELYLRINNVAKAREFVLAGLQIVSDRAEQKDYFRSIFYGYLGACHEKSARFDSAFYYLKKSVHGLKSETDTIAQANSLVFLGDAYLNFSRPDSAGLCYDAAMKLYTKLSNEPLANFMRIKKCYSGTLSKSSNKAELLASLEQAENRLTIYRSNYDVLLDIYDFLGKSYENLGNYKKSLAYIKRADSLSQKNLGREEHLIIVEFEKSYETLKKEKQINDLQNLNRIGELELESKSLELKRYTILTILIAVLLIGFVAFLILYYRKKRALMKAAHELNLQQLKQKERMRISKDLHDDIGSGLNKIYFLGEMLLKNTGRNEPAVQLAEKMKGTSKRLISNMRDLIWALDEENQQIETLIARIREYAYDYLEERDIQLNFSSTIDSASALGSIETVRTIISVIKEILSNILKHSEATKVTMEFTKKGDCLTMVITDNGKGYEEDKVKYGNGIKNIRMRAQDIGAEITIETKPAIGTRISLTLKIQKTNNAGA